MLFSTLFCSEAASHGPPLLCALRWCASPLPHIPLAQPPFSPTSPTAPFFPSSLHSEWQPVSVSGLHPLCSMWNTFYPTCTCTPGEAKTAHIPLQSHSTEHSRDPTLSAWKCHWNTDCDRSTAVKILPPGESNRGVFIAKLWKDGGFNSTDRAWQEEASSAVAFCC